MRRTSLFVVVCTIVWLSILAGMVGYQFAESRRAPQPLVDRVIPKITADPSTRSVPVKPRRTVKRPTNAALCLAQNLYFEARYEPTHAIEAIAATVFNRMESPGFPSSVCGVVYQRAQYSWTRDMSRWSVRPPNSFLRLASTLLDRRDAIQREWDVTHFHRYDIYPRWAPSLTYVGQFGAHLFYRM